MKLWRLAVRYDP